MLNYISMATAGLENITALLLGLFGFYCSLLKLKSLRKGTSDPVEEERSIHGDAIANAISFSTMPILDYVITSKYGIRKLKSEFAFRMHNGIDLISKFQNKKVFSGFNGRVIYVTNDWKEDDPRKCGNKVIIQISTKRGIFRLQYWHLNQVYVKPDDIVNPDTILGTYGNTGYSFGDHLHFQVEKSSQGKWISEDPLSFIKYTNKDYIR